MCDICKFDLVNTVTRALACAINTNTINEDGTCTILHTYAGVVSDAYALCLVLYNKSYLPLLRHALISPKLEGRQY